MLLSHTSSAANPTRRLLAWLPGFLCREEESLPLVGAAAGSIPGTRSICCYSHCSSWEHANCPLQSWTAVSCQREIMDPFSAGSVLPTAVSWKAPGGICTFGGEEGGASLCILIHMGKESDHSLTRRRSIHQINLTPSPTKLIIILLGDCTWFNGMNGVLGCWRCHYAVDITYGGRGARGLQVCPNLSFIFFSYDLE